MRIKSLDLQHLDKKLYPVIFDVQKFIDSVLRGIDVQKKYEPVITSGHRGGDAGVHGTFPSRGVDLRCRNKLFGKTVELYINDRWCYDTDRPHKGVALYHKKHLHLQVHPNTIKRVKE